MIHDVVELLRHSRETLLDWPNNDIVIPGLQSKPIHFGRDVGSHLPSLVVRHRLSGLTLAWYECCVNSPFQDKPGRRDQWTSCKKFMFSNPNDGITE
jgi:hypothetical protein